MAFIDTATRSQLIELYVAYFNRAPDADGLAYWSDKVANGGWTVATVARSFMDQTEVKSTYPDYMTSSEIVDKVYTNVLNRAADADGKTYWVNQLNTGKVTKADLIQAVVNAAKSTTGTATDAATLTNKTSVGEYFAVTLGSNDKAAAASIMTGVTSDAATVTAAKASSTAANGQTFTLTNSTDNVTGTSGNDTFIGDNVSGGAGDTITGGAGTDTLKMFATNTVPNFSGVENVYYNAPGGNLDMSVKSDVTNVEVDTFGTNQLTVGSGQAVKVTNQANGTTATIAGNAPTSLALTLDKSGIATADATIALTGTALDTLAVTASGNASYVTLTNAGAALKTITVNASKALSLQHALTTVTTIDASASTAGVTIDGIGASNLKFTGGSGNDSITMAATVTASDTLKGGAGVDTISVSDADTIDTAAEVANISEFEIFEAAGADATAYNLSVIGAKNTLTGLVVSVTGGNATVNNINAASVGAITINGDAAGTITLTGADFVSGGTSDTATITIDNSVLKAANGVDITSLVFANADVLNLVSKGDGSSTKTVGGAEENSVVLTATDAEKVVITGDESLAFSTAAGTLVTEVDASGLTNDAAVTVDTDASAIVSLLVKGTGKNDTIDLDNAATLTTTLYLGGGNDTVTVTGGGTGSHTAIYTATALNAGDLKAGASTTITLTGAATGDVVTLNFTSALEALLKSGGTVLGSATANTTISGTTIGANTNIAASQAGGNMDIQFDLNGDGVYTAADDVQIRIVGTGTDDTLVYNAASDVFTFTVV